MQVVREEVRDRRRVDELRDRQREHQDRRREDRRDHAGRVQAQREVAHPALHHLATDDAARVLDRDAALRTLAEHDEADERHHECQQHDGADQRELVGAHLLEERAECTRQAHDDAREDHQRDPVADAALGDLLAEPHDEGGARGERHRHHDAEAPAGNGHGALTELAVLERDREERALEQRDHHRRVAGPLRDLAAALIAFLLELLQRRDHDRQQLENDRGADVGHDAQREDRELLERAAREQIEEAEHRARHLVEEALDHLGIDPRRGDVRTEPIHGEHPEREQDASLQFGHAADVLETTCQARSSTRPPASSIFFCAAALAAFTFTVRFFGAVALGEQFHGSAGAGDHARASRAPRRRPSHRRRSRRACPR